MAFAGFAALLPPVAPPPFIGLGADRRAAVLTAQTCAADRCSSVTPTTAVGDKTIAVGGAVVAVTLCVCLG